MEYVALAPLVVLLLFVLINLVKGLLRGTIRTVGTLVSIILSAVAAFVVTVVVCKPTSPILTKLFELIEGILPAELLEIFADGSLGESLSYYLAMLAAPFFFLTAFSAITIVLSIIIRILLRIFFGKKKKSALSRLGGALIGIVCGVLVTVIALMPVVGTLNIASAVYELDAVREELPEGEELLEDGKVKIFLSVCAPLYDELASAKFEGEKVYLKNDIATVFAVINGVSALEGEIAEYGQKQIDALMGMVESLDDSPLLKNMLAEVLSTAASSWTEGKAFAGIEKPVASEMLAPIVDGMLKVLATSDKDNIGKDLETLASVFSIMIRSEMFKHSENFSAILTQLSETNAISELLEAINANERMTGLSDEITNLSIRALASSIGVPENEQERYDLLMGEIASIVTSSYGMSAEERSAAIAPDLEREFEHYGVDIGGEALANVCAGLVADLGNKANVVSSDVKEFFAIYAIASSESASLLTHGYDMLSNTSGAPEIVINDDGTISVNGVVFSSYDADSFRSSSAYGMGAAGAALDGAASLYSAEAMESTLVTMTDLISTIGKYGDCEDVIAESEKVGKIIAYALEVFDETDFEHISTPELMPKLGKVLDMMDESEIFGHKTSSTMLTAIFQSDRITGAIGISTSESTNFANKINEMVEGEKFDYVHATEVISDTITMMDAASNAEKTREEKTEDTQKLLDNISKDSAEMISALVTPSLVEKYGVSGSSSETVSSTVTSLLDNMANYENENDVSGEMAAKEAEAVSTLLDLAITASTSEGDLFNADSTIGSLDTTAEEFIELVVTSEVVYGTIDDTVYRDGNTDNPLGTNLSAEDSAQVVDALESYYDNNGGGDDLARKLEAIAIMLNVNIELDK